MNNIIDWKTLDFKKSKGMEKLRCPSCDGERTDKKDKSLVVYHNDGVGKCFYCDSLTFRDDIENKTKKEYKLPSQQWRNYTKLSDNMVKYLESRNISQITAINLGWTEEIYYQPSLQKQVNNIVFNTFEGDVLVNKKYRSANKKFTQSGGTKSIFYNINSAIGQKELWIVEGEMDVASLIEVGIKNVVSVPNGANDNDDFWRNSQSYIKDIESFVIATDNDEKGIILRNKIAQRLGRYRCTFVEFTNKDANGDLVAGCLEDSVKNKQRFPVSGTFKVQDLYNGIIDLYDNGLPKTIYPKAECFGDFGKTYSIMRGQLSVGTGIPSHGKSNFTDWKVLNLINENDLKASWFSPEHSPMSLYHTNLCEKVIGRNFWKDVNGVLRITKEEINKYKDWANEKIYLTGCEGNELPTWDWLLDKFKEQMYSFGIDIFVIDAFNKVILPKGNKLEQINIVLTKLTHFAQANNVMIILVAHPTKMQKNDAGVYNVPTLYDVSGSADFRNQTHNGYSIYRKWGNEENGTEDKTIFYNMKTKFNFQGEIGGIVEFNYCAVNGRYYVDGVDEPLYNMIDKKQPELIVSEKLPMMKPSEVFDNETNNDFDDCPF